MSLDLVRIDDRLIHGQVVLGWARVLKPDRIVVVNDRVAGSDWEKRLYRASVPRKLETSFLAMEEAVSELRSGAFDDESVVLLFESVVDMHRVAKAGVQFGEVNVGGLHYREGTREVFPFVYLSEEDRSLLMNLIREGVKFIAQDIPGNPAVNMNPLLTAGEPGPSAGV